MQAGSVFSERYRIVEVINDEQFLESYLAKDLQDNLTVRIDVFAQHDVPGEKSLIELEEELQKRVGLSHPNIIKLIAAGRYSLEMDLETIYMVSEHFESVPLSAKIVEAANSPFQFGQVLKIVKSIADGLAHLHSSRIPAWCITPRKLRINSALEVKLPAFSYLSSSQWLRNSSKLSRSTGTDYHYIAPEMICEAGLITGDEKTDVYLLGIIAFELGSGTQPFDGTKETIIQMHRTEPPPDLIRPNHLPDWYDKMIIACMDKTPVNRPFANNVSQLLTEKLASSDAEELSQEVSYIKGDAINVLFVEDNRLDQLFLSRLIKSEKYPFKFMFATSVRRATRLLEKREFDIVITDYLLPDGSALDLLKLNNKSPVLVVTGSDSDEVSAKVLGAGAYECVAKESEQKHLRRIPRLINRAVEFVRMKAELKALKEKYGEICSAGAKSE